VVELENENKSLSKGNLAVEGSHYFKKGDGQMSIRIRELEEETFQMREELSNSEMEKQLLITDLQAF